ncbi:unnamed protein product [Danaus chrysippus]|uniref:Abasic site processing protein HMCES n=1 Tax=Danaus chrysippus TaxID=151541 RepID=A0A8J2QS34_9NEOP|nr:unnamed protein product [Danaus chrysippus]
MCGRTSLSLNKEQVRCACAYKSRKENVYVKPEWKPEHNNGKDFIPSYNIAPTDITPVLIADNGSNTSNSLVRVLKPMMWGIIPPWHKGDYKGHNVSTNNCRIENIKTSNLYSPILHNGGRCIIIAEGFYEWQTTVKSKTKQPYYIYMPQGDKNETQDTEDKFSEINGWNGVKLIHMAGIYNIWKCEDKVIYSYSIITMESNDTMNWLHHRMPAVLDNDEQINVQKRLGLMLNT